MSEQFGAETLRFHDWAQGEDDGPLRATRQRVLEVAVEFEDPEMRRLALVGALDDWHANRRALSGRWVGCGITPRNCP